MRPQNVAFIFFKTLMAFVFHNGFWILSADVKLFSDSADGTGFGISFVGRWCCASWWADWFKSGLTKDIMVLVFFPVVVSQYLWGKELRNRKIVSL